MIFLQEWIHYTTRDCVSPLLVMKTLHEQKMSRLYEKAWNEVVQQLPDWKKKIVINNWPYTDSADSRIADEVAKEAARLAEQRESQ